MTSVRMIILFYILASILADVVNCQRVDDEFLGELDKAAKSVGSIKTTCSGPNAWLEDEELIGVSCHSMYQLCHRAVDSLYPERITLAHSDDESGNSTTVSMTEAYGYGFIMIVAVSLLSLLGLFIVPLLSSGNRFGRVAYKYVLTLLTAMGVSALLCGSLFELIPTVFHVHDHGDHGSHDADEDNHEHGSDQLWKASGVVGGVFLFYLFELILHSFMDNASQSKAPFPKKSQPEATDKVPLMNNRNLKVETHPVRGHNRNANCCQNVFSFKHVRPLAWIILMGDLIHNLADGITVGVAVSQSLTLGLSTTFAICLHEIPHELADFGILIKSGMHWIAALLFNFLSSLTALVGFFIGVAISTNSSILKEWLLAIAAGSFLYIALADLLPELRLSSHSHSHDHSQDHSQDHSHDRQQSHSWHHKILHGVTVLLGFVIAFVVLLVVSLNEDKLNDLF